MSYDNDRKFGLWETESKSGVKYFRFYDKETGEAFALFPSKSKHPRAPAFDLIHTPPKAKEPDEEDVPFL